jgi:hypothetical protein
MGDYGGGSKFDVFAITGRILKEDNMGNAIQLKKATSVKVGEQILKSHSSGVLLALKVVSVLSLNDDKWIEIGAAGGLHILRGKDVVVVVV